jgi:hypothetical protein
MPRTQERSPYIALAKPACAICAGTGWASPGRVCGCCWLQVFKECLAIYRICEYRTAGCPSVNLEATSGRQGLLYLGRMRYSEYRADFVNIAKRALTPALYAIFNLSFCQELPPEEACHHLRLDLATYGARLRWLPERLGEAYATIKPYALWPTDEYMSPSRTGDTVKASPAREQRPAHGPLRPPLRPKPAPVRKPKPAPVVMMPKPKPVVALPPLPPDTLQFIRERFADGWGPYRIALHLRQQRVAGPRGYGLYHVADVSRLLMTLPKAA